MKLAVATTAAVALGAGAVTFADGGRGGDDDLRERLTGFEEVPALSTPGNGVFRAEIDHDDGEIEWRLSFDDTETDVTQAHIHFENATNNGAIVVFLCSNLGNGPPGTQACPAGGGTVRGTIEADDVGAGAAGQGIAAGELDELIRAMRAGATYVNVHSVGRPGGEIRAQLGDDDHHRHHHDHD